MVIHQKIIIERKYCIQVNDFRSPIFRSAVGIPHGSVISPVLCNVYTSDSVSGIVNNHGKSVETSIWDSDYSIRSFCESIKQDVLIEKVGFCKWNMSTKKTEVMVRPWDGKQLTEDIIIKYYGAVLNTTCTKPKKKLGIVLDSNLIFKEHIQDKTNAGFVAWRDLDSSCGK